MPPPMAMSYPRANTATPSTGAGFKIVKKLGEGSYAEVYQVIREADGRTYALKETDLSGLSHAERMDAVQEIRLMVGIQHPQIVRCHEAFLKGNKLCTVMELAGSGDLKHCIRRQREHVRMAFPEEMVWNVCLQVSRGLAALHAKHVIHRDVKPANIFLCEGKFLKIGDLGVAKTLLHEMFTDTQIGTPAYMAPEVWAKTRYSFSSDLYSLGCILYEMMTYRLPYLARSMEEMRKCVMGGKLVPITPGTYSPELISLAHTLLSIDPRKRPTPEDIMKLPAAQKWMYLLPCIESAEPKARQASKGELARARGQTVMTPNHASTPMPRELRHLPKLLPEASYGSDDDAEERDQEPQGPKRKVAAAPGGGNASYWQVNNQPALPALPRGGKPPAGAPGAGAALPAFMYASLSPVAIHSHPTPGAAGGVRPPVGAGAAAPVRVGPAARAPPPPGGRAPFLPPRGAPVRSATPVGGRPVANSVPPPRGPLRAQNSLPRAGLMSANAKPGGFGRTGRPYVQTPAYGIVPGLGGPDAGPPARRQPGRTTYTGLVLPGSYGQRT